MNSLVSCRARGFTLLELLITIAIVVVLATLALPGMQSFYDRERLIGATEQIYSHLQQARIEAIARSRPIYTQFVVSSGALNYGISQNENCVPTQTTLTATDACVLIIDSGDGSSSATNDNADVSQNDIVLNSFDIDSFNGISVDSGSVQIRFEPLRGVASAGSVIQLSSRPPFDRKLNINVGLLGQISICSPDDSVLGYSPCGG